MPEFYAIPRFPLVGLRSKTSLDLIRIEIHGEGIPDDRHIDEAVVRIDYARGHIGDSDALLPKRSELTMNFLNGVAYRDVIGLSVPR